MGCEERAARIDGPLSFPETKPGPDFYGWARKIGAETCALLLSAAGKAGLQSPLLAARPCFSDEARNARLADVPV